MITLKELADKIDGILIGDKSILISSVDDITKATEKSMPPPPNDTTYTTPLLLKAITTKLGHIYRITRSAIPLQAPPSKNTYHTQ